MWLGVILDLLLGAGPWVFGVAIVAAGLSAIFVEVDGAKEGFNLLNAPVAVNAISTFAAFLLVGRQSSNLAKNASIIGEFGNLSGSLVNIALFVKAQASSGKSLEFLTLADGSGGFFQTTRIGLVCSSICYVVKYTGRGVTIIPEGLPLGQDARLLGSFKKLTAPANGSPGMSAFMACILMIGELVDEFSAGEKPSEYAVLFTQLNAVTAAEGAIGGTAGYSLAPFLCAIYFTSCTSCTFSCCFLQIWCLPTNTTQSDQLSSGLLHSRILPDQRAIRESYGAAQRACRPEALCFARVHRHRDRRNERVLSGEELSH